MKVILYNVNRNLNRALRTCFSFGITELFLFNDSPTELNLKGALYSAKEKVKLHSLHKDDINSIYKYYRICAFENYYNKSVYEVDWKGIEAILIGGESTGIPRKLKFYEMVKIPTVNNFCLTVEASLAIALSEWYRNVN
jgi:tRNA(Leu) C34 or U34 (ribose-2'-O)-methylase TrmL